MSAAGTDANDSRPTIRVPAALALLTLRQSGHEIKPNTLRMWVNRGHITRGPGGYDLGEILDYLDRRSPDRVNRREPNTSIG